MKYATCWLAPALTVIYIIMIIKLIGSPVDSFMVAILVLYWVNLTMNMVNKFIVFESNENMDVVMSVIGMYIVWIMLAILVFEMLRYKFVLTFTDPGEQ